MKNSRKASISTIMYAIVALTMLLLLMFLYFGHTGLFQRVYDVTDRLGITSISKSVKDIESEIEEGREAQLTEQEKKDEEQIKVIIKEMSDGIEKCLKQPACTCTIKMGTMPAGYVMRFTNNKAGKQASLNVFQIKYGNMYQLDYDDHFWGQTQVRFVPGATHVFRDSQACLVYDIEEEWNGEEVSKVQVRMPESDYLQMTWDGKGNIKAAEVTSVGWMMERDYDIYGYVPSSGTTSIYITRTNGKNFCFFGSRFIDDDNDLISKIKCDDSVREVRG